MFNLKIWGLCLKLKRAGGMMTVGLALSLTWTQAVAQINNREIAAKKADSIKSAYMNQLAIDYPFLREAKISTEFTGNSDETAKLFGKPLYQGKLRLSRQTATFNIPIEQTVKNTLYLNVNYLRQRFEISQITDFNPFIPIHDMDFDRLTGGLALGYIRNDSLFRHPVAISAALAGFSDVFSAVKRVNFSGSVVWPIRQSRNSALSLGVLVILDPSTPLPVLPVVNYWHQYGGHLKLFIDLPYRISLRKQFSKKIYGSAGTELYGTFCFFKLDQPPLPVNNTYGSLELKTGPAFECLLTRTLVIGINGGLLSTLVSREFERNTNPNDAYIKNSNSNVPYINLSLSLTRF